MVTHHERQLEAAVEATWRKRVREVGGRTIKLRATEDGVPDRLVLLPGGGIYLVEVKRDRASKPSAIQKLFHERAAEIGVQVYVVSGREEIRPWILARLAELEELREIQANLCTERGCYKRRSGRMRYCRPHARENGLLKT